VGGRRLHPWDFNFPALVVILDGTDVPKTKWDAFWSTSPLETRNLRIVPSRTIDICRRVYLYGIPKRHLFLDHGERVGYNLVVVEVESYDKTTIIHLF